MASPTPVPQAGPRVIIELNSDGTYKLESYVNGSRRQNSLTVGGEWFEIKEELKELLAVRQAADARKAERIAEAEASRHRQVWGSVAHKHGIGFANRVVNGIPNGETKAFGRYMLPDDAAKPKKEAKPPVDLQELISLLDD
jgi:hypothetical protein